MAFRMQSAVPPLMDLTSESPATLKHVRHRRRRTDGLRPPVPVARRFAEAGVRFIEIGTAGWDHHNDLKDEHAAKRAAKSIKPIAALLTDLKQRGLLEDTLVVWGGEFGRTPFAQGGNGRDHNNRGFTIWMAGGGVKAGFRYGAHRRLRLRGRREPRPHPRPARHHPAPARARSREAHLPLQRPRLPADRREGQRGEGHPRVRTPSRARTLSRRQFIAVTAQAAALAGIPAQAAPANTFRLWAIGDAHVGTDLKHGRESLADAIRQSEDGGEDGGPPFEWDLAVLLGDFSGSQVPPTDEEGPEVRRQMVVQPQARREDFYTLVGNHDASGPDEPTQWWFKKWIDPTGQSTEFSGVDPSKLPVPGRRHLGALSVPRRQHHLPDDGRPERWWAAGRARCVRWLPGRCRHQRDARLVAGIGGGKPRLDHRLGASPHVEGDDRRIWPLGGPCSGRARELEEPLPRLLCGCWPRRLIVPLLSGPDTRRPGVRAVPCRAPRGHRPLARRAHPHPPRRP